MLGFLAHTTTWADSPRVALVGAPPRVEQATITALEAWHIEVVALPADPDLRQPAPEDRARALAAEHGVAAVVWLAARAQQSVLALYDARRDEVTTRHLSAGPPFSEPAAASVALSIKTLLRNRALLRDRRLEPGAPAGAPAAPQAGAVAPSFGIGVAAEVHLRVGPGLAPEPRMGLALLWSPAIIGESYMLATVLDMGTSRSIHRHEFVGEFTDIALGVELRRRAWVGQRIEVAGLVAAMVHRTRMRGLVAGERQAAVRHNPSVGVGIALRMPLLSRLCGDVRVTGTYFPQRQTYTLGDRQLLQTPRVAAEAGIGVTVPLRW